MSQTVTRTDRLKAAHEKLQDAVAEIVTGDDWKRMLKVASNFHRYSFNNHLLEPGSVGLAVARCDARLARRESVYARFSSTRGAR